MTRQPMPSRSSLRETPETARQRAHKLETCTNCNNPTSEPLSGVEINGRFVCAKCWMKYLSRK
jgi:formylmethanofuran dehydrogenase subunit E